MSEARVLASVEVARDHAARVKGLLGRTGVEGALAITKCRSVHTLGMKFPIDVAYVGADEVVIKTETLKRNRLALPVLKARWVIEAEAGAFERWGLRAGHSVEIRETDPAASA